MHFSIQSFIDWNFNYYLMKFKQIFTEILKNYYFLFEF
jgi:hypothetical protein